MGVAADVSLLDAGAVANAGAGAVANAGAGAVANAGAEPSFVQRPASKIEILFDSHATCVRISSSLEFALICICVRRVIASCNSLTRYVDVNVCIFLD